MRVPPFPPAVKWLALAAAFVLAILVFRAGLLAVFAYAFGAILLAARIMPAVWLRPIEVKREVSDEILEIGDRVRVDVSIRNRAGYPILWLYVEETLAERFPTKGTTRRLIFLPPRRTFHLIYSMTMTHRGCHAIGPLVLETGDVFGLFKKCRVDSRRDYVTVLPIYQVVEEFQVGTRRRLGDLSVTRSIFDDPSSIRGIREYRTGDALKSIHWKSSARTGELRTKIYDPVMEAGATVILDFHEDSWTTPNYQDRSKDPAEMGIQIACTIARYLWDGGWKVGFFTNGRDPLGLAGLTIGEARATDSLGEALAAAKEGKKDERLAPISIPARRAPEQFEIIRENLGRLALSDGLRLEEALMEELPHIPRDQALVYVTGEVSDEFTSALTRIREHGYRIMLFVVCNDEAHDRAFDYLYPLGIEVFRMDLDWRLKEIATGRQSF